MALTARAVENVFTDCLPRDGEEHFVVEGVVNTFGLHRERLESHRGEVVALLAELPASFHERRGGGDTFAHACLTRDDLLWGEQPAAEKLVVLGLGLELVEFRFPRDEWPQLPDGLPILVVKQL